LFGKVKDILFSLYEHYASQQSKLASTTEMVDLTKDVESFDDWHLRAQVEFEMHAGAKKSLEKKRAYKVFR
jgi:hypothetical protein